MSSPSGVAPSQAPVDVSGNALIYFPINTNVSSVDVEVFGETISTSSRVLELVGTLPAANLAAFVKYQENPQNRDTVYITLDASKRADVVTDISGALHNTVNLSTSYANWWRDGAVQVSDAANHQQFTTLAELLLSQIAYDVLGHPMAKAGLANDQAILTSFETANIANLLVTDIEGAQSSGNLRSVYTQLFKQKPTRFQTQDSTAGAGANNTNDTLPKDLPLQAGDKIRFEITLNNYNVTQFSSQGATSVGNQTVTTEANSGLLYTVYGSNTYTVEVTLA